MKLQHDIQPRTENDTTTNNKMARRKLSPLELAAEAGDVSTACRRNFQLYGAEGRLDKVATAEAPARGLGVAPRTAPAQA